jgi:hypothetical protein
MLDVENTDKEHAVPIIGAEVANQLHSEGPIGPTPAEP